MRIARRANSSASAALTNAALGATNAIVVEGRVRLGASDFAGMSRQPGAQRYSHLYATAVFRRYGYIPHTDETVRLRNSLQSVRTFHMPGRARLLPERQLGARSRILMRRSVRKIGVGHCFGNVFVGANDDFDCVLLDDIVAGRRRQTVVHLYYGDVQMHLVGAHGRRLRVRGRDGQRYENCGAKQTPLHPRKQRVAMTDTQYLLRHFRGL